MYGYHVSTCTDLHRLSTLQRIPMNDVLFSFVHTTFSSYHFPYGLGQWGYRVLSTLSTIKNPECLNNSQKLALLERDIEYVRQSNYPHLPSRMECLFASETLEEAKAVWSPALRKTCSVFRVTSQMNGILCDASLLDGMVVTVETGPFERPRDFERICQYWDGCFSPSPKPELLLPLPCAVLSRYAL